MCGVCGFCVHEPPGFDAHRALADMTRALSHRGPDGEGAFVDGPVHLGHRRLAVVDVEGGAQPMSSEDGRVVVSCNGEVFNFPELRRRLEAAGHRFRTRCDTEVLVHLWEDVGPDLPRHLDGQFAFALWDRRDRTLFLARDRFGEKPLYYAPLPAAFLFASELTALLRHPLARPEVDPDALRLYLLYDVVPAPQTILRGVFKVEPGCSLTVRDGTVRHERYWDLAFPPPDRAPPAFPEACERLRDLLAASVRRRLLSDVPLGVFLSGGVDSSSVAALLARSGAAPVVDTFSVGFADPSFDESRHAARVAARLGTRHHDRLLDEATMLRLLPGIVSRLDEPLADNSLVPTYFLARFARERVTVALGGDGGDELLLGYPTFAAHGIARLCGVLPASWRALGARLADLLPVSTANVSLDFRARRFAHGLRYERFDRHFVWIGGLPPDEHAALLAPDWARRATGDPFAPVHRHLARCRPRDDADALSYLYAKIYLGDDILAKVDRATMMNSLEARAPFLEPELAEFLAGLPTSYKLRGFETKRVLKRALEPWVGRDVVRRAKKGFGLPVAAWLKAPLREWASDLLSRRNLERWGHFAPGRVEALWQEHLSGRRDNRKVLWSLLVFLLWLDANLGRARA